MRSRSCTCCTSWILTANTGRIEVRRRMSNQAKNLNDDMVKLVAYSIVSIRREDERVLDGGEGTVLIIEPMTEENFTAYIIGHYLQQEVTNDKEDAIRELVTALDRYLR